MFIINIPARNFKGYHCGHRLNLTRWPRGDNVPPMFFSTQKQIFWLLSSGGANKNWADSGGNGCMYLKGWFKSVFPM